MKTAPWKIKTLFTVILGLVTLNFAGCVASDKASVINCRWVPRLNSPTPVRTAEPSTIEQPPKNEEASEEYRERHPSMWKRKLRAMYASA